MFNEAWYQGSLYSSSIFIVPFLIHQLQDESEPNELDYILFYLAHLATGVPCRPNRRDINFDLEIRRLLIGEKIPEFYEIERGDRIGWAKFTYESIDRGIEIYLNLLRHPSSDVRVGAIYLLSCCRSETEKICNRIYELFRYETDEMVKVTIFLYFAFISQASVSQSIALDIQFIEGIVNSDERDIVKLSAAIALAFMAGIQISNTSVDSLISLLEKPDLLEHLFKHYDRMIMAHNLMIIDFFKNLSDRNFRRILPSLIEASQNIYAISDFFDIVFKNKNDLANKTFEQLTESQKFILQSIALDEKFSSDNIYTYGILESNRSFSNTELRKKIIDFIDRNIPIYF